MIVAVCTSSPQASVALVHADGGLVASRERMAAMSHSQAVLELLAELMTEKATSWDAVQGFVADVGPGSFTGTKVGVTIVKALGFALHLPVAGVPSFDLIGPGPVIVPARKGEFWLRVPGMEPTLGPLKTDALGYGDGLEEQTYPHARLVACLCDGLAWGPSHELAPNYGLEPSISQPKRQLGVPGR